MTNEEALDNALEHYLEKAKDDDQIKKKLQDAAKVSWKELTKVAKEEFNMDCPPRWTDCGDGSCAPPGVAC
jgi:hypothetical protein